MLVAKKNVNNFIEQGNTRTHTRAMTLSFLRHSLSLSRGSFVSWRHTLPMHAQNVSMYHQQRQNMSVRAVRSILAFSILVQISPAGCPSDTSTRADRGQIARWLAHILICSR